MAAAGSSLGPTCLSLFLASRPPRSPHLDLFLPPTKRERAAAPWTPLLSSRSAEERWGGLGFARAPRSGEKGFLFFFLSAFRFARPPVNPFFRVLEYRVDLGAARELRAMPNFGTCLVHKQYRCACAVVGSVTYVFGKSMGNVKFTLFKRRDGSSFPSTVG